MENTINQGYPINNPFGSSQRGNLSSMGTPTLQGNLLKKVLCH